MFHVERPLSRLAFELPTYAVDACLETHHSPALSLLRPGPSHAFHPTGPLNLPVVIEPLQGLVGSLVPPPQHPLSNTKDLIINLHAWHPVGD